MTFDPPITVTAGFSLRMLSQRTTPNTRKDFFAPSSRENAAPSILAVSPPRIPNPLARTRIVPFNNEPVTLFGFRFSDYGHGSGAG